MGKPLAGACAAALKLPTNLVNDARAFGIAELRLGAGRGAASMVGLDEYTMDNAKSIKDRVEADFFNRPGVVGVGIGRASDNKDSLDSNDAAIIVYVETATGKLPKGFPREIDGVKVRVIPTDAIVAR
jgi:hypothetical protein